jgi:hypothetical protein
MPRKKKGQPAEEMPEAKFTALLAAIKGKGAKDIGGRPEAEVTLGAALASQTIGLLWDMADGHAVEVTVRRLQLQMPSSSNQPTLDGGPTKEVPCAGCGMVKGHQADCSQVRKANSQGSKTKVPDAFAEAWGSPDADSISEKAKPDQATQTKPRPARSKLAKFPTGEPPMLCQECERPLDDHAYGCSIGEQRGEPEIDMRP